MTCSTDIARSPAPGIAPRHPHPCLSHPNRSLGLLAGRASTTRLHVAIVEGVALVDDSYFVAVDLPIVR